ncbi:MAG TPA: hypothetical protein VJ717_06355 [Gemmatimonadaceae bacterium]|nr:hypothetical protein [Gemmatimonadaceae bacterium]
MMNRPYLLPAILFAALACGPRANQQEPVPDGLWDAHTHVTYWGEDALDSLTKYGIVGVRDLGGDPVLLRKWRAEIARGQRRGPRIYYSGPHINGPRDDSTNRLIVRTPDDARRVVDSLFKLGVDFIKTHRGLSREAYFAVLRYAKARGLKVASHTPETVAVWEAADSGAASIEHMSDCILPSPMFVGYAKTLREAADWWLSPAGDTMIAHMARTGVAITPALHAYVPFIEMGATPESRASRQRVYEFHKDLTRRFHKAGLTILAGSDFAIPDKDLHPGRSLHQELEILAQAGLSPAEVKAAASTNIVNWLRRSP